MGVVSRCMTYTDFLDLFNKFSVTVKQKKYNPLPYQDYKAFQRCIADVDYEIIIDYDTRDHVILVFTTKKMFKFEVDGNSFGAFLFDELEIENDLWNDPYIWEDPYSDYNSDKRTQSTSSKCYPVKNYKLKADIAANENAVNSIKEDNKMKFNFDFGPVDSNIRMSPFGMAIKNAEGTYVSYNAVDKQIVDVDVFNFSGSNFMMKMPVALNDVKPGDIVVHQRKPMFVTNIDGNILGVIDIYSGEAKGVVPTTNMFGFNFVTKVVSFLDMGTPSKENPFGNMWPLFMMGDGKMDKKQMFMFMFMMSQTQGAPANLFQNPMFVMALMQDGGMDDMMPMFMAMMMSQNKNLGHVCNCGNCGHQE